MTKPAAVEVGQTVAPATVSVVPDEDPRITALRTSTDHLFIRASVNGNDEKEYLVRIKFKGYPLWEPQGGPYYRLSQALDARRTWTDEDAVKWFECEAGELQELRDLIDEAEAVEGLRRR